MEQGAKATILGFFNLLPWADIRLARWDAPIDLMFVLGMTGGAGTLAFQAKVTEESTNNAVVEGLLPVKFPPGSVTANIAIGFQGLLFPGEGRYLFQLDVEGRHLYSDSFAVSRAPVVAPAGNS
jgi:hypothetical protein